MDKRFLAATGVGTVVLFFAGFLIYGVILAGYWAENMNAPVVVDVIGSTLMSAIGGAAIGATIGKVSEKAAE